MNLLMENLINLIIILAFLPMGLFFLLHYNREKKRAANIGSITKTFRKRLKYVIKHNILNKKGGN